MVQAKILVLDSDTKPYQPLKSGLAEHGYEIHTTMSAREALSMAGAHPYQAALVALTLAQDGDLLLGLQAECPGLPLIIVSCPEVCPMPPPVVRLADNTVGKPLTLDTLRLMLDRTLELALLRSRLRRERQDWSEVLAPLTTNGAAADEPAPNRASLDEVLVKKLRTTESSSTSRMVSLPPTFGLAALGGVTRPWATRGNVMVKLVPSSKRVSTSICPWFCFTIP
jgi:hypothetical protein